MNKDGGREKVRLLQLESTVFRIGVHSYSDKRICWPSHAACVLWAGQKNLKGVICD